MNDNAQWVDEQLALRHAEWIKAQLPNWRIKPFELPPLGLVPAGFDLIPEKRTDNWNPEQIAGYMAMRARSQRFIARMIANWHEQQQQA